MMEVVLEKALKNYRAKFGEDFDPHWNPRSEHDLEERLRSSNINFKSWRLKHERLWKSYWATAKPIISLGQLISQAVSIPCPPASVALGGLVSLITVCATVSETYDFVEQMLAKLEDIFSRWKLDTEHEINEILKQKMQQIMLVILGIIARSRILIKQSRVKRYFASLVFGKDEETADLVEQLETLLLSEDRAKITFSLNILNSLWEKALQSENADLVHQLLRSPVFEPNARSFCEQSEERLHETGHWLREHPLYCRWRSNEYPMLLVLGGPGTGKSFLATGVVEEMI